MNKYFIKLKKQERLNSNFDFTSRDFNVFLKFNIILPTTFDLPYILFTVLVEQVTNDCIGDTQYFELKIYFYNQQVPGINFKFPLSSLLFNFKSI